MSPGRWRRLAAPLAAALLLSGLAVPARAAYQATIAVNDTAFDTVCLGFEDSYPEKMYAAAKAAYTRLGYTSMGMSGAAFTRASLLTGVADDWGFYVHSHGDYYWHAADGRRYSGFREDSGDCAQAVIYSKDIAAKRGVHQSNLVFISTCHNGDPGTTLPGAFAIGKSKATGEKWNGPEFYLGYLGDAWDNDQWQFEQVYWDTIGPGLGTGRSFDEALAQVFVHDLEADWWGTYNYGGRPGLFSGCPNCS